MNRKFKALIGLFFTFTIMGNAFGYFEKNMYCKVISQNIKISLNKKDGINCKVFIVFIEQRMKATYVDVLTIQKYIKRKQDAGYRIPVKDLKVKHINDLQALRLNILASMKTFENSLSEKSKELFVSETSKYKEKLIHTLTQIQALSGVDLRQYNREIQLMNTTLEIIKKIEEAENLEDLTNEYRRYIYFRKQIEGK